jgi:hypothetical protein
VRFASNVTQAQLAFNVPLMLGSAEFGRCEHCRQVLRLRIQAPVPLLKLLDPAMEFIDFVHALAQQEFEPADMIPFICQLAAQLQDGGPQRVIWGRLGSANGERSELIPLAILLSRRVRMHPAIFLDSRRVSGGSRPPACDLGSSSGGEETPSLARIAASNRGGIIDFIAQRLA